MSGPSPQVTSAARIRQEFEDLVRRDLLGPAGGDQEIIMEQSVRNRYLLGMLAPLKGTEVEEEPLDELADDSEDNPEEGTAEPSTPVKRGTTPSTFGLSFCLDLVETEFEAEARWGQYLREQDAEGKLIWKRYPRGGAKKIPLAEGNLPEWSRDTETPHVTVRGRIRRRADHWSVTLFLSTNRRRDGLGTCTGCSRHNWMCGGGFPGGLDKGTFRPWTRFPALRTRRTKCCTGATWSLPVVTASASNASLARRTGITLSRSARRLCRARWCAAFNRRQSRIWLRT